MTNPIGGSGDPLFALASMLVERDNLRAAIDDENLRAARNEERRALAEQVAALHDAADHVRTGALISGGLTLAGAGASAYLSGLTPGSDAAKRRIDSGKSVANGVAELAEPAGAFLGHAERLHAEAEAKQAEGRGADAAARAEDARRHGERLGREIERSLDAIGQALDTEAQGNLAIIANV
jgi:hypothetical protein